MNSIRNMKSINSNNLTLKAKEMATQGGSAAVTEHDQQTNHNEQDFINIELQDELIKETKESSKNSKNSTSEIQSAEKKSKKVSDNNKDSVIA